MTSYDKKVEAIWRQKTDGEVFSAAKRLEDYTEVARRAILAEVARRRLTHDSTLSKAGQLPGRLKRRREPSPLIADILAPFAKIVFGIVALVFLVAAVLGLWDYFTEDLSADCIEVAEKVKRGSRPDGTLTVQGLQDLAAVGADKLRKCTDELERSR
jgi:hypothetical protein